MASEASNHHRTIVVGIDGSDASHGALRCAAAGAAPDGSLVVVTAYDEPPSYLGRSEYNRLLVHREEAAQAVLDAAGLDGLGVPVETEMMAAHAAEAIDTVARSHKADWIVVGSHGHGRAGAVLGSVSHTLLGRADRPVVIVPERAKDAPAVIAPGGPEA